MKCPYNKFIRKTQMHLENGDVETIIRSTFSECAGKDCPFYRNKSGTYIHRDYCIRTYSEIPFLEQK